jgi:hypothetical protein
MVWEALKDAETVFSGPEQTFDLTVSLLFGSLV